MTDPEPKPVPLPGDVIQATTPDDRHGRLFLITQVKAWGIGAIQDTGGGKAIYYRFRDGEYVIIGPAYMLPEDLAKARADSIRTAAHHAQEQG